MTLKFSRVLDVVEITGRDTCACKVATNEVRPFVSYRANSGITTKTMVGRYRGQ